MTRRVMANRRIATKHRIILILSVVVSNELCRAAFELDPIAGFCGEYRMLKLHFLLPLVPFVAEGGYVFSTGW
jgi:hypothetical protein